MIEPEPIHLTVPGSPDDPRLPRDVPKGAIVHCVPALDPHDVCIVDGIKVTSPSRTLIDLAEIMDRKQLYESFRHARTLGLLDLDELAAARSRVEWRPSLAMFDEVVAEFS